VSEQQEGLGYSLIATKAGQGVALIAAERVRHVEEEGYTAEHDAGHVQEDLALAAACYATPARRRGYNAYSNDVPAKWPWEHYFWKPTPDDRVRELVKAGALIAAEIDRLLASGAPEGDR